ncbi:MULTISPECIES: NtaA/DmoA family FMN-dependent monooxygenase [Bacillus]|uniref:LLM class flavin-dependent oxidoreductase n=1 Tax=Bacillus toyonensis TaxID=155322 RepID=A0AB36SF38_9BACI|nr:MULTISPECIES: NtaA/DmoA family FMN-dependent monooxygenase [Bacillus]EEL23785.1 Monooxygenase, NtaA/SnaA/SoxA [Bacillus cereus Rock1-3]KXY19198.1 monooxygenase [Bacillus cereus]MDH8704839.1 FMN-dependent oxidoreductase (nitrilotriacetate monooxygenase family) [Stenotrophomonas sp. 1198]MDP9745104.1 FMN-dependent oxidoreductase (nitrilotriacetate monooxygenase family) [Bacillus thuringiensis]AHA10173.1 Nitrilotriacetate monooxygenase component A [Bacillus toyonensis BCT-7112]
MSTKKKLCIGLCLISRKKEQESMFNSGIDEQVELALQAEEAKLDFVFKADYLVAHPDLIARNKGNVMLDPTLLFTAIAYATEKIGVVTTASTSFYPPYILARQLQSLNWISNGRVGWNIVTSIDGAENFGETGMPPSEERYAKAAECTELVRKLWRSHPYEVLKVDNTEVIREMVKPIEHSGEYFEVKGPLNIPQHISGEMPLFQAGASEAGRNFAASVADAIFAAMPDIESGIELRQNLRRRAEKHGRKQDDVRVLPGLYFFIGDTYEEALEMHRQAHQHLTMEKRLALLEMVLGLDARGILLESKIKEDMLPSREQTVRSKTHAELLRNFIIKNEPTVEQILERPEVVCSAHWVAIGTPQDVFQQIMERFEAGALDGFIAIPGGPQKSLDLFFSEVIPLFVKAGIFREEYTGSTLREHLEGTSLNTLLLK